MKKGFTLIELLVVITILGILAGFAIPQYKRTLIRARMADVYTMMDSIRKACDVQRAEGIAPTMTWSTETNASWALDVVRPSFEPFIPDDINCGYVHWSGNTFDEYQCEMNQVTGKFCCPSTDITAGQPGFANQMEREIFVQSMSRRYHSCEGM